MTSRHPSTEADIRVLSDLRAGSRRIGVRAIRALTRACDRAKLLDHALHARDSLLDAAASVARDDAGTPSLREKAAEFVLHLRGRKTATRSVSDVVDQIAEAAAATRYRSGRVMDYLASWLFIAGEEFISGLSDRPIAVDLETAHLQAWSRFRFNLLEILEAGGERLRAGRRFRVSEVYLARLRLIRARNLERDRAAAWQEGDPGTRGDGPDYISSMVADLFALCLTERQQALIVAKIPAGGLPARSGFDEHDHRRLWAPLRAVRTDQAYERWPRLIEELGLSDREALREYADGMIAHLTRVWEWFFPDRKPFGILRATLHELESSRTRGAEESPGEDGGSGADEKVDSLFRRYGETLSFIARLASEDAASAGYAADDEEAPATGVF